MSACVDVGTIRATINNKQAVQLSILRSDSGIFVPCFDDVPMLPVY